MNRLRDLREDRDLKQSDIAKILNISQQYYQCYESGKNEIPTRHLITLAKFYNISIDYMVGITDAPRTLDGSEPQVSVSKSAEIAAKIESSDKKIKKAIQVLLDIEQ